MRLAFLGFSLASGSIGSTASNPPTDWLSFVINLAVALTGLVAAVSALVLQIRSRRDKDPRDKLLELLLEEHQKEARDEAKSAGRRNRRRPST